MNYTNTSKECQKPLLSPKKVKNGKNNQTEISIEQLVYFDRVGKIKKKVMDESIGAPATFPDNAPFPSEKGCNYKCVGIHVYFL